MPGAGCRVPASSSALELLDPPRLARPLVEPGAEQLQEDPLGPLVVARVDRGEAAAVVVVDAQPAQLGADRLDVGLGGDPRVLPRLDGELLGGQAERVIAHGVQDVVAVHAAEPAGDVGTQVAQRVPDVQPRARRVREHVHHEELGAVLDPLEARAQPAGRVGRVERALGLPAVLPRELDPLRQRRGVAVRGHVPARLLDVRLVGGLAHRGAPGSRPTAGMKKPLTQEGPPRCLLWSDQHGWGSWSPPVTAPILPRGTGSPSAPSVGDGRPDGLTRSGCPGSCRVRPPPPGSR